MTRRFQTVLLYAVSLLFIASFIFFNSLAFAATPTSVTPSEDGLAKDISITVNGTNFAPVVQWLGLANDVANNVAVRDLAVDSAGNSYVAVWFGGTTTIGTTEYTAQGSLDVALVKFSPTGSVQWVRTGVGSGNYDRPFGVKVMSNGSVTMSGAYNGDMTFGSETLTYSSGIDGFIVNYDSDGNLNWAQSATTSGNVYLESVTEAGDGSVIVAGWSNNTLTIDGVGTSAITGYSSYLINLTVADGSRNWVLADGTDDTTVAAYEVEVDSSGNIYVGGDFAGSPTIAGTSLSSLGSNDGFLAKYNSAGVGQWVVTGGDTGYDYFMSPVAFNDGSVAVVGNVGDNGGLLYSEATSSDTFTTTQYGNTDIILSKYTSSGELQWIESYGGTGYEGSYDLFLNSQEDIILSGEFNSASAAFGSTNLSTNGGTDLAIANISKNNGSTNWVVSYGSTNADTPNGVGVDADDNIIFGGQLYAELDFGTFSATGATTPRRGFIAKLAAPTVEIGSISCTNPDLESATAIACTIPAQYQTGTYDVRVENADGSFTTIADAFTVVGFSAASSTNTTAARAPGCSLFAPRGGIELFEIKRSADTATLYFTPLTSDISAYHLVYGYEQGDERFGGLSLSARDFDQSGVQQITVGSLDPNQIYWFQIIPINGCAAGMRSNWLQSNTNRIFSYLYQ